MAGLYRTETEMSLGNNVIVTQMTQAINWARKYSFFIYPFITACCGMEFMSVAGPRYDLDRMGADWEKLLMETVQSMAEFRRQLVEEFVGAASGS